MLPGLDGLEVCRLIQRERHVPVLMLTARDSETDLEVGLGVGSRRLHDEALQSSRARRASARAPTPSRARPRARVATSSGWVHSRSTRRRGGSRANGVDVHLTPTEFDLLHRLALTPHVVFGRRRLLEDVWGYRVGQGERTVDSHVRAIRRKLGANVIRTVHGIGYALDTNEPVRPLDFLPSIKLKLGVVIVAAVIVTVVVVLLGERAGLSPFLTGIAAVAAGARHGATARPRHDVARCARWSARRGRCRAASTSGESRRPRETRSGSSDAPSIAWRPTLPRSTVSAEISSQTCRMSCGRHSVRCARCSRTSSTASKPRTPRVSRAMLGHVERLGGLVEQLLDLSRLESGAVPLERTPVRASVLLERVATDWRQSARARGVGLQLVVEPEQPRSQRRRGPPAPGRVEPGRECDSSRAGGHGRHHRGPGPTGEAPSSR